MNWVSKRNSPVTAFSQPIGLGPVATGSGKRSHHLQTIIQCPHLDLLSAPVTGPVSVTNSNKHPELITLLPLNPTVLKKEQKNIPNRAAVGYFPPFFLFFFPSVRSFMFNCYETHVCSYAKLSKVWVRFTSHLVTVQRGRAAWLVLSLLGFSQGLFTLQCSISAYSFSLLTAVFGCSHATTFTRN